MKKSNEKISSSSTPKQNNNLSLSRILKAGLVIAAATGSYLLARSIGRFWNNDSIEKESPLHQSDATAIQTSTNIIRVEQSTQALSVLSLDDSSSKKIARSDTSTSKPFVKFTELNLLSNDFQINRPLKSNRYQITTCIELQNMSQDLRGNYMLANDVDCSDTKDWNNGTGFIPIGNENTPFIGVLNGQNYQIRNLYINSNQSFTGLFGCIDVSNITNLSLVQHTISSNVNNNSYTGALAGTSGPGTTIINVYADGVVRVLVQGDNGYVGGLIGAGGGNLSHVSVAGKVNSEIGNTGYTGGIIGSHSGLLTDSRSTASVFAKGTIQAMAGGLVGILTGNISQSSSSGSVQSAGDSSCSGGLVAMLAYANANIFNSYSDAFVSGDNQTNCVGGLAGYNYLGSIYRSYAKGKVTAIANEQLAHRLGGLVGILQSGRIVDSYATGPVDSNNSQIGGLVGMTWNSSGPTSIVNSYAIGKVASDNLYDRGGLVGSITGSLNISNSYYDTNTTGQSDTGKGIPQTTIQMRQYQIFADWDFSNTWKIEQDCDYPKLAWQNDRFNINFATIGSPQQIMSPFTISINTTSLNFNASISLYSMRGKISPLYVKLVNSQWTGNITLYSIGKENSLGLRWFSDSGYCSGVSKSNVFDVVDQNQQIPNDAIITGTVTDNDENPIANATVELYAGHPKKGGISLGLSVITDSEGNYEVDQVTPSHLYLRIQKAGYQDSIQAVETATKRKITGNAILCSACLPADFANGKVPVLLVPGVMGSKSSGIVYPRLPFITPTWNEEDEDKLKLHDPASKVGWDKIKGRLKKRGYISGCTLFDVPYDWSLPIENIRDNFLIPWINKAKKTTNSNQVDIIAHSMGGLVVRTYVQSPNYAGDIRKFAIVGTPSKGADIAYYSWEGGDPKTADEIMGNTEGLWAFEGKYFYTNTLYYLYLERQFKKVCKFEFFDGYTPKSCNKAKIYDFLHFEGRSLGQLMPTYDTALLNYQTFNPVYVIQEENTLIRSLNNLACRNSNSCKNFYGQPYTFYPPATVLSNDGSKVQTKLFVGAIEQTTINSIYVKPQAPDYTKRFYKDGEPQRFSRAIGDSTVLKISVIFNDYFPPGQELSYITKDVLHAELIREFRKEIVSFITGTEQPVNNCSTISQTEPSFDIEKEEPIVTPPTLAIRIDGRVQLLLNESGNAHINQELDLIYAEFNLINITTGNYTVTLNSSYNESYEMSIIYFAENQTIVGSRNTGFYDKTLTSFALVINTTNSQVPMQFDRTFQTPIDLQMQNGSDYKMLLTWEDLVGNTNQDVAYYDIFWRHNYEPYLQFLDNSLLKKYQTNHSWQEAIENTYVVRSLLKNGRSTFFSPPTWVDDAVEELPANKQSLNPALKRMGLFSAPNYPKKDRSFSADKKESQNLRV